MHCEECVYTLTTYSNTYMFEILHVNAEYNIMKSYRNPFCTLLADVAMIFFSG